MKKFAAIAIALCATTATAMADGGAHRQLTEKCGDAFDTILDAKIINVIGPERYREIVMIRITASKGDIKSQSADDAVSKQLESWILGGKIDGAELILASKAAMLEAAEESECKNDIDHFILNLQADQARTTFDKYGPIYKALAPKNGNTL